MTDPVFLRLQYASSIIQSNVQRLKKGADEGARTCAFTSEYNYMYVSVCV